MTQCLFTTGCCEHNRSIAQRGDLRWLVDAGVVLVLVLLAVGWSLVPAASPIAAASVLIAYAMLAHVTRDDGQTGRIEDSVGDIWRAGACRLPC